MSHSARSLVVLAMAFAVCGCAAVAAALEVRPEPSPAAGGPATSLHYAPNGTFGKGPHAGIYEPGKDGFDLADVSTLEQLEMLPTNVLGLVYLGLCGGADRSFEMTVKPIVGTAKLYGFYLMDEPSPTGEPGNPRCRASKLKSEADWIHVNAPAAKTFIVLDNLGTPLQPDYMNTYNSANTGIELFGLDPYPCMKELKGCNYSVIKAGVSAAQAAGIETKQIVPVYQAFGGDPKSSAYWDWTLPTAAQEREILSTWGSLVPTPAFDFAYSWGRQDKDRALEDSRSLQAVFAARNR